MRMLTIRFLVLAVISIVSAGVWAAPLARYTLYHDGRVEIAPERKLSVVAYPHAWRGKSATQHFLDETNATDTVTWSLRRDGDVYGKGRTTLTQGADGKARCRFPDETYSTMLFWKENRPLVRAGAATITLRLVRPQECEVWALETDGSRACRVESRVENGNLSFIARVAPPTAHFAYEIVRH